MLKNVKTEVAELVDENISLNRVNRSLWVGLIGLAALGICSIGSCRKNAKNLEKANQENTTLKADLSNFKNDAVSLALENQNLKHYANEVNAFLNTIVMEINDPANFESSEDSKLSVLEKAEKMVKVESKQYEAERDAALKTLGIGDEKSKATLMRLRRTPRGL